MYRPFYFVDSLPDLTHLHKVDPFLSKLIKLFHQECFCNIHTFYVPNLVFELVNIHLLGLISWKFNKHCMRKIIILIVPYFCNTFINFITREILPASEGKHQVGYNHQHYGYFQDLPSHIKVMVPHYYCKPYWTCHFFVNFGGAVDETERYI